MTQIIIIEKIFSALALELPVKSFHQGHLMSEYLEHILLSV